MLRTSFNSNRLAVEKRVCIANIPARNLFHDRSGRPKDVCVRGVYNISVPCTLHFHAVKRRASCVMLRASLRSGLGRSKCERIAILVNMRSPGPREKGALGGDSFDRIKKNATSTLVPWECKSVQEWKTEHVKRPELHHGSRPRHTGVENQVDTG